MPEQQLAALLEAAYAPTHELSEADDGGAPLFPLRAAPSAGALYPLELYVAVVCVADLAVGLYHHDPLDGVLEELAVGDQRDSLAALSSYPEIVSSCAGLVVVTAVFWRTRFKYGLRGYRFALLEAGHLVQNMLLAAAALGLAAVPLGGFYDRRTERYLGVDGVHEAPLYLVAVGTAEDA
jgi:SagB-type dehydrogenase family enzyme